MIRHPATGSVLALVVGLSAIAVPLTAAQTQPQYQTPAHISTVDGLALLERQNRAEAAAINVPLLAGDRLRTGRGRLEVLFPDGSTLDLDSFTSVDLSSDTLLCLFTGRIRLTISGTDPTEAVTYRVHTPGGIVDVRTVGEYRIAITGSVQWPRVELAVIRGRADLSTDRGTAAVGSGERSAARLDGVPSPPYAYNVARWDAFDRWIEARRSVRLGVASAARLPAGLHQYGGTFDRYGTWEPHAVHGYVWYPSVGASWRPYSHGGWRWVGPFGWTWIGFDSWSWPTHHYGRWGLSAGRWYWIPGSHWGPAWVSWASAPGYVAWCPLDSHNHPIVSFVLAWGDSRPAGRYRHDGWTVIPRRHFGHDGRAVSTYAASATSLDPVTRTQFTEHRPAGLVVSRGPSAIVATGRSPNRAVPRAGAPAPLAPPRATSGSARTPLASAARRSVPSSGPLLPGDRSSASPGYGSLAAPSGRLPSTASSDRVVRIVGQAQPARPRAVALDGRVSSETWPEVSQQRARARSLSGAPTGQSGTPRPAVPAGTPPATAGLRSLAPVAPTFSRFPATPVRLTGPDRPVGGPTRSPASARPRAAGPTARAVPLSSSASANPPVAGGARVRSAGSRPAVRVPPTRATAPAAGTRRRPRSGG